MGAQPASQLKLRTATVSPFAERHSAWWFYAGFREMYDTGKRGMEIADDVLTLTPNGCGLAIPTNPPCVPRDREAGHPAA